RPQRSLAVARRARRHDQVAPLRRAQDAPGEAAMDDAGEALTDIDRLLADALDVDVPAEFSARVRRRIAATGSQPAAHWGWQSAWPAGVVAAVLIAATVLTVRLNRDASPAQMPLAGRPLAIELARPAQEAPGRNVVAAAILTQATRAHALPSSPTARTEPEVLVPREEIAM